MYDVSEEYIIKDGTYSWFEIDPYIIYRTPPTSQMFAIVSKGTLLLREYG